MTETLKRTEMPITVRVARFIMTLQVAFGLVGLAWAIFAFFSTFHLGIGLILAATATLLTLTGLLAERLRRRSDRIRWAAIAVQVVLAATTVTFKAVDRELYPSVMFDADVLGPAIVITLLLVPPAWRWFDRR
ncbi:hypothetical protein HII36_11925 [Nonomuraea sp. NN258]|uniref:hypothetical protein n=1 Tax=Nonomuraea antri TaxID=2730852 RepID=UPI00156869AD|nr:hypothetical protein [Nonomuraea antri]NRQ32542.1 hypothetical protein [Nonomuraea antri]